MPNITIAYACDNNLITLTLTSMASILKNAKKSDNIEFIILYSPSHLSEKYLPTFDNLHGIKDYTLKLIKIDEKVFDGFPCPNWVTVETWYRCLLADILPDTDKILYLDCDTIVRSSLSDLFKTDMQDNLVGVVEDISKSKENALRIGLTDNFYFNAGVLLINTKAWRKLDLFNRLKSIVMTDNRICNDQDALNKTCDNAKLRLSPKYDYMHVWWRKNTPEYDDKYLKELDKAKSNPVIIHFTGIKPNNPICKNDFTSEFIDYTALVPAYDILHKETAVAKTGKGRQKLPLWKRLLWIERSSDRKHLYINILGISIKLKH